MDINTILQCIGCGYLVGAFSGVAISSFVKSKYYGVDGKKKVEDYMSSKYGTDWLEKVGLIKENRCCGRCDGQEDICYTD